MINKIQLPPDTKDMGSFLNIIRDTFVFKKRMKEITNATETLNRVLRRYAVYRDADKRLAEAESTKAQACYDLAEAKARLTEAENLMKDADKLIKHGLEGSDLLEGRQSSFLADVSKSKLCMKRQREENDARLRTGNESLDIREAVIRGKERAVKVKEAKLKAIAKDFSMSMEV